MVIRLVTFFLIGIILFTVFSIFLTDLLGYLWTVLAVLLVLGVAYLTYHYIKKILLLLKDEH
ncbi:hypothetical protein [Halobacillus massiliensis]|uniref:hypothetical protein n=1 Tax=Halobacillus massiliensis TaxID=1926286 RepID=UPI0009E3B315|nr:hypothetical protein [Halobacillus massiliensis]